MLVILDILRGCSESGAVGLRPDPTSFYPSSSYLSSDFSPRLQSGSAASSSSRVEPARVLLHPAPAASAPAALRLHMSLHGQGGFNPWSTLVPTEISPLLYLHITLGASLGSCTQQQ